MAAGKGERMEPTTWTIKRCLDWTRDYLRDKGEERPRYIAEWLLSAATGMSRLFIYTNFDQPLNKRELDRMHEYVVRRAKGEPVQYIVGKTQFRSIEVACEAPVLIPRPETEMLVEEVLSFIDEQVLGRSVNEGGLAHARAELPWNAEVERARQAEEAARKAEAAQQDAGRRAEAAGDAAQQMQAADDVVNQDIGQQDATQQAKAAEDAASHRAPARVARVLEVGTGTGCIALSLAAERPGEVAVVATDIDPRAVSLASRNREALGIEPRTVDIRLGDLTAPVLPAERQTFDVLVSNPPYIPSKVVDGLGGEVRDHESRGALDGGADGLDVFRRLVAEVPATVRPGGLFACELFEDALDRAASIADAAGLIDVRVVQDLAQRPRFLLARVSAGGSGACAVAAPGAGSHELA